MAPQVGCTTYCCQLKPGKQIVVSVLHSVFLPYPSLRWSDTHVVCDVYSGKLNGFDQIEIILTDI